MGRSMEGEVVVNNDGVRKIMEFLGRQCSNCGEIFIIFRSISFDRLGLVLMLGLVPLCH